jgi:hypothetical protein
MAKKKTGGDKKKPGGDMAALKAWQLDDGLDELDKIVDRNAKKKGTRALIDACLDIFERHPDVGGEEFKGVVHALEKMPRYKARLVQSMRRVPSCYGARLVNRLLNGGVNKVGTVDLIDLLQESLNHPELDSGARSDIEEFLRYQGVSPVPRKPAKPARARSGVTGDDLLALLGKPGDGPEVRAMEKRLGEKGRLTGRDQRGGYLEFAKAGVNFYVPKNEGLNSLFMPRETNVPTPLPLPKGLRISMSRAEVRALLGKPTKERPPKAFGKLVFPAADDFELPDCSLTVKYAPEGDRVVMVQVCLPEK